MFAASGVQREAAGAGRSSAGGRRVFRAAIGGLLLLAAVLGGCRASLPHADQAIPVPISSNAELCAYVSELPYVTAEAAYRAVHILYTGELHEGDFDSLVDALAEMKLIDRSWNYEPFEFVHRSSIGYMICRACGIKSGLNWWLTGTGRYAWRELQYRRIARTDAGELGLMPGGEFLGVLARAEEHLFKVGRPKSPRAALGDEPN